MRNNSACNIPDHSLLVVDVALTEFSLLRSQSDPDRKTMSGNYQKEYRVAEIPSDFMNTVNVKNDITNFIEQLNTKNPTQETVNDHYKRFIEILENEMSRTLSKVKKRSISNNNRNRCSFWNEHLNSLFKMAAEAEKRLCKVKYNSPHRHVLIEEFKIKQNEFDTAFRKAKRQYNRKNEIEIESMVNKSGRQMWKKLELIGPKTLQNEIPECVLLDGVIVTDINIVLNKWQQDFYSLYSNDTGIENFEFLKEAEKSLSTGIGQNYDSQLNSVITVDEVKCMTKCLKKEKGVSVDKVPNEVLKNDSSVELLCALYNICFMNALLPDAWRKSLIAPIYKGKGKDPKEPFSYRPVSLISNPCKGLSFILNKRLLAHLEESGRLVEEQNGFRQGRSCEDHIFCLTNIIRRRLGKKQSTFCCF